MFISRQKAVITAALCLAVGILPTGARADNSVIISDEQLVYTLHTHLYASSLSLPSSDEFQTAAVCFINDTEACADGMFGGGTSSDVPSFDLNPDERCYNEGYTITSCPDGYKAGGKKCPYGPYYSECVVACPSSYVSCEEPYVGVGEACDGKYASCTCEPCGTGYDYTTISEGYIQDGESCLDCDGQTKYKVKVNPCEGFQDCGSMGGEVGAKTCLSGSQIKYDNCKACPNLGTLSSCPSPFTCTYEECSNRYYKSGCQSGYDWDSSAQTCTPQCASTYKYTCTGANQTGGIGTTCGGKYTACKCISGYKWSNGSCTACSSSYKYTCTGTGYSGGSGTACGGKYTACTCSSGYIWNGGKCNKIENACMKGSQLGYILNSDMTVTSSKQSGKTPIGVVVCSYSGGGGQAMALNSLNTEYKWGGNDKDISSLTNYASASSASQDVASCENSKKIMAAGNKSKCPAVWAANEYKTEGTSAGDWCLPAAGIFTSYYNNQDAINSGFTKAGGTQFTGSTYAWSSSENSGSRAWYSRIYYEYGLYDEAKYGSFEVRPVIGFCKSGYGYDKSTDTCKSCGSTYKYTCSGTGYAGGSGTACGGKYTACKCSSGYSWSGESCAQENACMKGSQLGYILNSDMTVTSSKQSGKTPIGVVVCSYANGGGQAMALKSLGDYKWSTENVDISGLTNVGLLTAPRDVASCENSAKIRAHGDSSIHPAVWAAYNYSTEGTKVGDWCLPAAGIFISYYHNQNVINTGFIRAGGTTFTIATYAWSSSEDGSTWVWVSYFDHSSGLHNGYKPDSNEVRPVLEF